MEYRKLLQEMHVFYDPQYSYPKDAYLDHWSSDLYLDCDYMYAYMRVYGIRDGSKTIPTYEEMKKLYYEYDESVYQKFLILYNWAKSSKIWRVSKYFISISVALHLYEKKYGEFRETDHWQSLDEMIRLEDFIRENPDFMPADQYAKDLKWLYINVE